MGIEAAEVPPRRWPRPTVSGWLLAVAVAAIALDLGMDGFRERRERLLGAADNLARLAQDYRDGGNLLVATRHEHESREFTAAAERPWLSAPRTERFPTPGWSPPKDSPGP